MKEKGMIFLKISELKPYENNPRINDNAVDAVANSIKEFGFKVPIIIDKNNVIIAGHTRLKAAEKLGLKEVPVIIADDLTDNQIKAFRLADNKVGELAEWNYELLENELNNIDFDMSLFNFDKIKELQFNGGNNGILSNNYVVPPFSILDTKSGDWQKRKSNWKQIIHSEIGRDEDLIGGGFRELAEKAGGNYSNGSSIFDPVLCEVLINWFCPKKSKILDVFAGGSVRGLISSFLNRQYVGIDLRQEQIEANYNNYKELENEKDFFENKLQCPKWICEDSLNVDTIVNDNEFDFLFTCPPYADLEVYSDDIRDLSNMEYNNFIKVYSEIFLKSYSKLKENAFACLVVGEVRNKEGNYYNFVSDTINVMKNAGFEYYNECILLNVIGTAAIRAEGQFNNSRKVVKIHQNVLVFVKGDPKKIELEKIDYDITNYLQNNVN